MKNHNLIACVATGAVVLLAGCASTPPQSATYNQAQALYDQIRNDPAVARSGATQLRSASKNLEDAGNLLADDADMMEIEQSAYLALRHAEIAQQQGLRSELEAQVAQAEERRNQLELASRTAEAEALRQQMAAMQAKQTERGMVLTLGDVLFDVGKADLKPAAERTITRLADFMSQYPERRVLIEGYTDSTGDEGFNQKLSEDRANSVRDALATNNIARNRIDTMGYGESYPKATNDTSSGRQQNRRVEIVISDEQGNIPTR